MIVDRMQFCSEFEWISPSNTSANAYRMAIADEAAVAPVAHQTSRAQAPHCRLADRTGVHARREPGRSVAERLRIGEHGKRVADSMLVPAPHDDARNPLTYAHSLRRSGVRSTRAGTGNRCESWRLAKAHAGAAMKSAPISESCIPGSGRRRGVRQRRQDPPSGRDQPAGDCRSLASNAPGHHLHRGSSGLALLERLVVDERRPQGGHAW